ncbi:2-amino-4-hydroxy-6-hydroxymethyldihydropteridine diphosphokinase [Candidatus Macondimonas diazotrophica]|jgi:2-amino-4-hydroxy-6-hydroxymethyldihydropteridine diphosphokinase|uniref:2-amino-4-hydroxy-6-hydroxymethyldihydropteridine pyrophosphokinase n=1 Tax=Candidatus Macondimonas diazotrophica TaxID=2305248 RepID=A0A4Z0F9U1_9GAMM|nr:2-amino-4-hydroxy-6-hydroxymethyldihydropteridine diphosphokinase [Candidatus Macondimonas diazotrophica]NCU02020.1 2-amino-4-hydroxy-6-hydroxymethyldihydropteridine diphosphokinase [Candidatus Macondimonas diazotrophica]TFZ82465.1 2-amino-4-hydroxy-6-hydroxymethyldihydropteridine diphosphokinase [Candidatus Macondimonas diazotrophica]HBG50219.1 2-amino-4-hydroxy-6-hydroxymethyldihydropteridine diphosphokinase [Gammaproteobacteria bacterium]
MSDRPTTVYVGLGSNRLNPVRQMSHALTALGQLPRTRLRAVSAYYVSAPVGCRAQAPFVNAVAALETALRPMTLLRALQRIERQQGRRRGRKRWGPRPLDLDLLLYAGQRIRTVRLQVPHPRLLQRAFVLRPLCEIAPGIGVPPHRARLRARLRRMGSQPVRRLDFPE